jgi:hypothetical protein
MVILYQRREGVNEKKLEIQTLCKHQPTRHCDRIIRPKTFFELFFGFRNERNVADRSDDVRPRDTSITYEYYDYLGSQTKNIELEHEERKLL